MGFNDMFANVMGGGENSDRIFTKAGIKLKYMSGKQPIPFSLIPAMDPNNPDVRTSYLPSILPDGRLSEWGNFAFVYRGIGHGDWKERCDVVSLRTVGETCPIELVYQAAKNDSAWSYITEEGKWGDPNRVRAVIPRCQMLMFANVFLPNETNRVSHVGIFSRTLATKLAGETGIIYQPSRATPAQIEADYLAAYANGDITDPNNAIEFIVEKGHDKGEMSGYEIKYSLDANRRVRSNQLTQDILGSRVNIADLSAYLNILSAEQIVNLLIREMNGRSPAGYHEHALLREVLGGRYTIPEPPPAPAATHTIQAGFSPAQVPLPTQTTGTAPVQEAYTTASAVPAPPYTSPAPAPAAAPQYNAPTPAPAPTAVPPTPASGEIGAAMKAATAAGAISAPQAAHVPGDPVPKFDKNAFLSRVAGGNQ